MNPAELSPALYAELRRIAWRHLGLERRNHTLQPTALVHEAYLKLASVRDRAFTDQTHFLAVASRAMRQVLVDYARGRATKKRAGDRRGVSLEESFAEAAPESNLELLQLIELDSALTALACENSRVARLVELCYFGGMTAEQAAEALEISVHVARHDLRFGQAWLRRRLQ
jgi:RNA polymerase sigma factor (TIGR02999 family)